MGADNNYWWNVGKLAGMLAIVLIIAFASEQSVSFEIALVFFASLALSL